MSDATPHAMRRALARAEAGKALSVDEAEALLSARGEALERLMARRTTFVIGHRLSTIIRADKIVVLDRGRVAEIGTHAELLARGGTYQRIYQDQLIPT